MISKVLEEEQAILHHNSGNSFASELISIWQEPLRLFRLANRLRQKTSKDEVSFVINRNINFTNQCIGSCRFCSFKNKDRYFLTSEEILQKAAEAETFGATEICLQGGLFSGMKLEDYAKILETVHESFPRMHLHAFSPMEVMHMSRNSKVNVRIALMELKQSGLGSLPGTAAEILVDSVRQKICPEKLNANEWQRIIETAHSLGIPSTSTILFGHVENFLDRIRHLEILKEIQSRTRGFTELVLLPFIPDDNELGMSVRPRNLLEDLKMHAIARIALYPYINNIQASWPKLGREAAAAALSWGANDLGGTLMDEKIARNPRESSGISAEEIAGLIESTGKKAVQRTTLYERIR